MSGLESLHALIARAEKAAVGCDGPGLEEATECLRAATSDLEHFHLSPEELDDLRERLVRYREVCRVMGQTLESALRHASEADGLYAEQGTAVQGDSRALVQRYG